MFRTLALASVAAMGLAGLSPAADFVPADDDVIAFDVIRDGRQLGTHIVRFEREGDTLRVVSDVDLRVGLGPLTLFRYEHDATEYWENNQLVRFESRTLKDGERLHVSAERAGDQLDINGMSYDAEPLRVQLPAALSVSSHWRGYQSDSTAIFNTETGEAMDVVITDLGTETMTINGRSVSAQRLRMEGTLTVDLWYGPDGEWLKCEFEARGETVVYIRTDAWPNYARRMNENPGARFRGL